MTASKPPIRTFERVTFRLICTPCCHTTLCYVNPRLPNYCSECGERLLGRIRKHVLFTDENAQLKYTDPELTT